MNVSKLTPGYWVAKIGTEAIGWALALLVVACIGLTVWGLKRKVEVQQAVIREVAGDRVADAVWQRGAAAIDEIKVIQDEQAERAYRANPSSADTPVADDIADILRKPAD